MGQKINWDGFKYPKDCGLSPRAKATLISVANSGKCDPFRQCERGKSGKCPQNIQRECFENILDVKDARKN